MAKLLNGDDERRKVTPIKEEIIYQDNWGLLITEFSFEDAPSVKVGTFSPLRQAMAELWEFETEEVDELKKRLDIVKEQVEEFKKAKEQDAGTNSDNEATTPSEG